MPVSPPSQLLANLKRLSETLTAHCECDAAQTNAARHWAAKMPLTHGTSIGSLKAILDSKALLSQAQVGSRVGQAETILETRDDVFLYLGAFSYPNTECGILFLQSLEKNHQDKGVPTPFDSGAYGCKFSPPGGYADGPSFVRAHELPIPGYRELLRTVILQYAPSPLHYLRSASSFACHCGVSLTHPFEITQGDDRTSSFEVRVPQRVALQPPHLLAVFVKKGYELPELSTLFALGVKIERYEAATEDNSFDAMRDSCVIFIEEYLTP